MARKKKHTEMAMNNKAAPSEPEVCPYCLDDPADFEYVKTMFGQRIFRCSSCGKLTVYSYMYDLWLEKYESN